MKKIKFNINDNVYVKLTNEGKRAYQEYRSKYDLNALGIKAPTVKKENGYSVFQMWEVMQIFGPYIYMGCPVPFETEIKLGVVDEK